MLLTIAFPTYNRERSVANAIESVLARARGVDGKDYEVLVLDNASTDSTPEVIRALKARNPAAPIRYARNERNLGYDGNHLAAYRAAAGEYVWFCSDRYLYDVDVKHLVEIASAEAPAAITFSSVFRSIWAPVRTDAPDNAWDDWLDSRLPGRSATLAGGRVLITTTEAIRTSGALKAGVPAANVSDCIVRRDLSPSWLEHLATYDGSYMLVIACILHALADASGSVAVLKLPWFSCAFGRVDYGGARHDNLRVADANLRLTTDFPFLGSRAEIASKQLSALLQVRRESRAGRRQDGVDYSVGAIRGFLAKSGYTPSPLESLRLAAASLPGPFERALFRLDRLLASAARRLLR